MVLWSCPHLRPGRMGGGHRSFIVLAAMLAPEIKRRPLAAVGEHGRLLSSSFSAWPLMGNASSLTRCPPCSSRAATPRCSSATRSGPRPFTSPPTTAHRDGPDAFALVYPHYQSAAWVAGLGPNYLVDGAHDIFMNVLADQGFIGLLLFLALLAYVSLRSIGAWRRLRTLERGETEADEVREEAQRHRITVAMVTASMVAYIVQAVFNVQQVGLSFSFWLLIGCSTVMALSGGT